MYKKAILLLLILILIPSVVGFNHVRRVFVTEPLSLDEPEVFVAVENPTKHDMDETKVRAYMDDGSMLYSNPFDLESETTVLKRMYGTLPYMESGLHYMRVVVSEKGRKLGTRYVPVLVG